MIQYGALLKDTFTTGTYVHMDDTTYDTLDKCMQDAYHSYSMGIEVMGVFSIDDETGIITQLHNRDQIESEFEEWEVVL